VPTRGGVVVNVSGIMFGHPLPVSVWLLRGPGGRVTPPWTSTHPLPSTASEYADVQLLCPAIPAYTSTSSAACVVPEGSGTHWRLVVVNHDVVDPGAVAEVVPGNASTATSTAPLSNERWQASSLPALYIHYLPPVVTAVTALQRSTPPQQPGTGGSSVANTSVAAPAMGAAAGGFLLSITGDNFSKVPPLVMVGTLPCTVLPGSSNHTNILCTAPPRQLDRPSTVTVTVDGQATTWSQFRYAPPAVLSVHPRVLWAALPNATSLRPRVLVTGVNFGARFDASAAGNHAVLVGGVPCTALVWASDSELSCVPQGVLPAGPSTLTVVVGVEADASPPFPLTLQCPPGLYGRPGEHCMACPDHAACPGADSDPVALPGYFPVARARFVACAVASACLGDADASVLRNGAGNLQGCARNYQGQLCALCREGSFRRGGKCPNNAWLLFLGFAGAIVACVAAAVYLSKKRINMAGLSVGVVRSLQVDM
jgi:hypothetical protein